MGDRRMSEIAGDKDSQYVNFGTLELVSGRTVKFARFSVSKRGTTVYDAVQSFDASGADGESRVAGMTKIIHATLGEFYADETINGLIENGEFSGDVFANLIEELTSQVTEKKTS